MNILRFWVGLFVVYSLAVEWRFVGAVYSLTGRFSFSTSKNTKNPNLLLVRQARHKSLPAVLSSNTNGTDYTNFCAYSLHCFSSAVLTHFICFASAVFATYGS
jgi:hypothetical protein